MSTYPTFEVVDRPAETTVGITGPVTMDNFAPVADRLPGLLGWLDDQQVGLAGPPFFRYRVIDMAREMIITAGVAVADPVDAEAFPDGDLVAEELPAGRYVTTTFTGPPDRLMGVTGDLLDWAAGEGLNFDRHDTDAGDAWACRLELYRTDPREVAFDQWVTTLAFKLAD